ncbi:MAG: hypothetical protein KAS57_02170 [Gammaproteobacteria bacterium]|nr:hypothetical protein [Gammaproteobacteria bacterium]
MARFITLILIIIAAVSSFFMYKVQDVGYLTAGLGDYTFETTLLMAGGALLLGIFALLLIFKLASLLHKIILFFGASRKVRLLEKARSALSHGLIDLAEGRFAEAEKLLLKQVKHSDNLLLTYLSAARAAQQQGEHERRDDYLRKAHEATPAAEIAIGLTKAELQLAHGQYEQALANLTHLYELAPKHAYVLKLLLKTYRHLADWKNIQILLIDVKKPQLLSKEKIRDLELETWRGLLSDQSHCKELSSLTTIWYKLPDALKSDTKLVEYYALLLLDLNVVNRAEQVLRDYLNSNWSESAVVLYSELDVEIDNLELEQVESWLQEHQHNAYLLLALGKRCLSKKLWGKARHHLEASLSIHAMPETYLKLAKLLEQHMDEARLAQTYYQKGLECLAGEKHHETETGLAHHNNEKPVLKVIQSEGV